MNKEEICRRKSNEKFKESIIILRNGKEADVSKTIFLQILAAMI